MELLVSKRNFSYRELFGLILRNVSRDFYYAHNAIRYLRWTGQVAREIVNNRVVYRVLVPNNVLRLPVFRYQYVWEYTNETHKEKTPYYFAELRVFIYTYSPLSYGRTDFEREKFLRNMLFKFENMFPSLLSATGKGSAKRIDTGFEGEMVDQDEAEGYAHDVIYGYGRVKSYEYLFRYDPASGDWLLVKSNIIVETE